MKTKYLLSTLICLLAFNSLFSQKREKISLVFPKEKISNTNILNDIKLTLLADSLTDSINISGTPYPAIVIEPDREKLLYYYLTDNDILKAIKTKFEIPIYPNSDNRGFYCKLNDFKTLGPDYKIDDIGTVSLKGVGSNNKLNLMNVASIYLRLHKDEIYRKNKQVYLLSFSYKMETQDQLDQLLKSIDKYGVIYEVDNRILSQQNK